MSSKPSKSSIKAQAARLRNKPGWNPHERSGPDLMGRLQELDQELKNEQTYEDTDSCEACQMARTESDDPSALCDTHLQQALGF